MNNTVVKFGKLGIIPAVGSADEITGYALETVNSLAVADGTFLEILGGVFVAAVHATVTVVVDRAIADIVLIHEIYDRGDGVGVVCGVAVDLNIEDVAATGECMVGRFNLGFVSGTAVIVNRHVVGVGIVDLVGDAGDYTERLAVFCSELA